MMMKALGMKFLLNFLCCVIFSKATTTELRLIDQAELQASIPTTSTWDLVLQTPYWGVIEVAPSPVNKFQILINTTSDSSVDINYIVKRNEESMVIELSARRDSAQSYSTLGDEEKVYVQLLLVTIAGLVLVVFVVSIIFSCWWLRSQTCDRLEQPDNQVYYVKVPQEVIEEQHVTGKPKSAEFDTQDEPELIELSSRMAAQANQIVNDLPTAQLYITPTTAFATISLPSNPDLFLHGARPTTYPLPRYVVAGEMSTCGVSSLFHSDTPVQVLSASHEMSPENAVTYLRLDELPGYSTGQITGFDSLCMHTLPVRRHVATEFLDETVLSTMTRSRPKVTPIQPEFTALPTQYSLIAPGASPLTSPLLPSVVLISQDASGPLKAPHDFSMYSAISLVEVISPNSVALFTSPPMRNLGQSPQLVHTVPRSASETPCAPQVPSTTEGHDSSTKVDTSSVAPPPDSTSEVTPAMLAGLASCPQHSHLLMRAIPESVTSTEAATPSTGSAAKSPVSTQNDDIPKAILIGPSALQQMNEPISQPNKNLKAAKPMGPHPPRRGVSLAGNNQESVSETVEKSVEPSTTGDAENPLASFPEYKSATLGRTPPTNGVLTEEDSDMSSLAPGSSATLPSVSNPRSALKSADRSGPKVSKHLRFTTLTLLTFIWLSMAIVFGSPSSTKQQQQQQHAKVSHHWNIIRAAPPKENPPNLSHTPWVRITIWLPSDMIPSGNFSTVNQPRNSLTKPSRRAPDSVQLWLNASSQTEVWLAPAIARSTIQIYDAVNAHQNLGSRVCRQRYACEHSCDPGARHDCICQRGYRPAGPQDKEQLMMHGKHVGSLDLDSHQGRICLDVDECARVDVRRQCQRLGGICTNRPGDFACLCPTGKPCRDCQTPCPPGYWMTGECGLNRSVECLPCSGPCPTGMFQSEPCSSHSDRVCQACQPLCISDEFEFSPCKASSNRQCKRKSFIPEMILPYKKNVWFENRLLARDATFTIASDELGRLPPNRSIILDRGSGYQIRLDFDSLNLLPVLGPVDHSSSNDNTLFFAAARSLDRTVGEPDAYRWSSASGHYSTSGEAYALKANSTLSRLCPYPVPPLYRLGIRVHRNVTTATVPDPSLPGHRPVLAPCRTYRRHGYFPTADAQTASDPYNKAHDDPPVVVCLEPSRLPAIFGAQWNAELASPRAIYYEEKQLCSQLKSDCQHCLATCAEQLKSSSLTCKPTPHPADNGRSPRLEICFDCCARDNCTEVCAKYSAHRCQMQLCHYGLRLDFPLAPEWPKQGEFLCHMQPASSRPIYRLHWSLLYHGRPLTPDLFPAALHLPLSSGDDSAKIPEQSSNSPHSGYLGSIGQLEQVYRGLLNVHYSSGLDHLPDMIGGTDTMQSAYFWSKQTIPLIPGSALNSAFDPGTSAATAGAMYASAAQSATPSDYSNSIQVWPSTPLGVSTASWSRLSGAPCAAADPLLEQLNLYTPALPPYIAMGEAKVEYVGNYLYTVSHAKVKPKLTLSVLKSASVLGAVFSPASVERGHYLRASLALASMSKSDVELDGAAADAKESRYWVIDLTGQVDQFPGLFRLRVYPEGGKRNPRSDRHATVEIEDETDAGRMEYAGGLDEIDEQEDEEPLLDYDVGVFEERKFQLRILIPSPIGEPDYEKSFRLSISDAKNRLDIHVTRKVQPPEDMTSLGNYEGLNDDDTHPSLNDLFPSLIVERNPHEALIDDEMDFGPPPAAVYAVLCILLVLTLCLTIGIATKPDPSQAWIQLRNDQTSRITDERGDHVILVKNPAHSQSALSRWFRVCLLIGYLCIKSAYTFGVTLTTLVIVVRYVTRDPAHQLANIPEWNNGPQSDAILSTSQTKQKMLQDSMDVHLKQELVRQQHAVRHMHESCDRGLEQMYAQLEERLGAASKQSAARRSRVLLSQGVAELARVNAMSSALQLAEGLMNFNQTTEWALQRLRSDLVEAERALGSSDWLTGARILYTEVVRLRGLTPDPKDPTRSFLQWARLIPRNSPSMEDTRDPELHPPSILDLLQPERFEVPTPAVMNPGASGEEDEPEYGPAYVPFVAGPIEVETHEPFYTDGQPSMTDSNDWDFDEDATFADRNASILPAQSPSGLFHSFQLGWVHVLGAALLLDALWLIHRVLHTIDTAERLLYGDTVFVDLTVDGIRRRFCEKSRLCEGCKRVFEAATQPGAVRKICGSVLALLLVTQSAAHVDRLLSEETLKHIGYYDNLILPVHLHARLVNAHVARSAQRLNQYEVAGLESETSRQYREAQLLLQHWTTWLQDIEREQCRILLAYKTAAQDIRTQMATKLQRNPSLSKLQLPLHMVHSRETTNPQQPSPRMDAFVPRHCRMTQTELDTELAEVNRLQVPECALDAIVPGLFKGYNASEYFDHVVKRSEVWLNAARGYAGRLIYCLFVYVSALVLWNATGSVLWFYLNRLHILPKKVFYESDLPSWQVPTPEPASQ